MRADSSLQREFASVPGIDAGEARFLDGAVRDAVRGARRTGTYLCRIQRYEVRAWREPLGARLVTVTWRVSRNGRPVAGDTEIMGVPAVAS